MIRMMAATAVVSVAMTLLAVYVSGAPARSGEVKLEKPRAKVTQMVFQPGVARERYVRATDQVIVFLDDCRYERTDSKTGEKTVRDRKSGDVIWHDKGEDAPVLINKGAKAYRTLVIELP